MRRTILKIADISNRRFSSFGDRAFFDNDHFPWVQIVESCAKDITCEYDEYRKKEGKSYSMLEISGGKNAITETNDWQVVSLIFYGSPVSDDPSYFPNTVKAISNIPAIKTAFFSVLPAGAKLDPHFGPFNGVLRYHLGIKIPQGDCGIRVGHEVRTWVEGSSLIRGFPLNVTALAAN